MSMTARPINSRMGRPNSSAKPAKPMSNARFWNCFCTVVLGLFDVDQGQTCDGAHVQAGADNIDHAGRDHEVDVELLEIPRKVAQALPWNCSVAATATALLPVAMTARETADSSRWGCFEAGDGDFGARRGARDACANHVIPGPGLAGQRNGEIADRAGAADDEKSGDASAKALARSDDYFAGARNGKKSNNSPAGRAIAR